MSRPRTRNGRFLSPGAIPGAHGCEPPTAPFEVCGVVWSEMDAGPLGAPIGLSLAMEWRDAAQTTSQDEGAA